MKYILMIMALASIGLVGSLIHAGAKAKTQEQRIVALEAYQAQSDQAITILVSRSEYLKAHLDALEEASGRVRFRAGR